MLFIYTESMFQFAASESDQVLVVHNILVCRQCTVHWKVGVGKYAHQSVDTR